VSFKVVKTVSTCLFTGSAVDTNHQSFLASI
jgi:hypothetical protein